MERAASSARAGFALACALLALALPRPGPRAEPCRRPQLRAPGEVVCAPAGAGGGRLAGPARRLFGLPIDPNRADPVTLETLPGIGPVRARAIVAERCRRPFAAVADLQRVHGLGPARVAALEPHVAFEARLAPCDGASVRSPTCRSTCGTAGAGSRPAPPAEGP